VQRREVRWGSQRGAKKDDGDLVSLSVCGSWRQGSREPRESEGISLLGLELGLLGLMS
jgi:hypothetical protein